MTTWRKILYGSEAPSKLQYFAIHSLLVFTALVIYGYNCNFAASPFGVDFAFYSCIVVTIVLSTYLWHGYGSGKIPFAADTSYAKRLLALLVIPVVIFAGFWLIFAKALPNMAAIIIGQQASLSVELEKYESYSRKQCKYQLRGAYLKPSLHICIDAEKYSSLPARGIITLKGKSTMFGIHVTDVES